VAHLKKERKLEELEDRVLRKIFGPKRDGITVSLAPELAS
jgi:hypothetical protein